MRVLVIDDDNNWVERITELTKSFGHEVLIASSWKQALSILRHTVIDAMTLDLHLGCNSEDGLLLLTILHEEGRDIPVMIVSHSVDSMGVTGQCYGFGCVEEVIPKKRFIEFSFHFQKFFRRCLTYQKDQPMTDYSRMFVVHGRNIPDRDRIVAILNGLRVIPIYLEREATSGRTIIEMVEHFSDVNYAVVVMSADDIGAFANNPDDIAPRARQNVVLEIGYLMGKLGRKRIMILRDEHIEFPSDLAGMRWVKLSESKNFIKDAMIRDFQELGNINYQV